jgi:hypothetical protein
LLAIARHDAGQARRVADFLLAWHNAGENGGWDPTDLRRVDDAIRALIAVMVYSFARINAVLEMKVSDYLCRGAAAGSSCMRKAGKNTSSPATTTSSNILMNTSPLPASPEMRRPPIPHHRAEDRQATRHVAAGRLSHDPAPGARGRDQDADRKPYPPRHRHHGLSSQLWQAGTRADHGDHCSPRATKLYDRRPEEISLDEVERIAI